MRNRRSGRLQRRRSTWRSTRVLWMGLGIDASRRVRLDDGGTVLGRWLVAHNGERLGELFVELAEIAPPESLPIAIERGEGLVVELIVDAGHTVLMVDPAGFKAARPRWGSAGAKSDLGDAYMLADYARTDGHRLRRVQPVAQATRDLAVLVRRGRRWSRPARRRRTSCGRCWPSTGRAPEPCSRS